MPPLVGAPLWSSCTARAALLERREAPYFFCAPQAARVRVMCIMKELASCILELDATQVNSSSRLYYPISHERKRLTTKMARAHNSGAQLRTVSLCENLPETRGWNFGGVLQAVADVWRALQSKRRQPAVLGLARGAVAPVPCNPGPPGPNPRAICGQPKASFFFFSHGTAFIKNKQTFA